MNDIKYKKGKGYILNEKAYKNIEKQQDGTYMLPESKEELTSEQKELITVKIKCGQSKPKILAELGISNKIFLAFVRERFGSAKITEIRDKLGKAKPE